MAGLRGNQASIGLAKQVAKGTPNTTYTDTYLYVGGDLSPTRTTAQLSETDSTRQEGETYVQQTASEGNPQVYVRDSNIHHLLAAVLGAQADSGSTNFTHTITPSAALSYYTFVGSLGGTLWEQLNDCMVSELAFSATAGSPLTATATILGLSATRLTVAPTVPAQPTDHVYNFNDATVTLSGGATSLVSSFDLSIANNVTNQQTDDSKPYDVVPGQFQVSGGFDLIFETLAEYNKFHYGGTAGTAQVASTYTTDLDFTFDNGINNQVKFTFPKVAYETFPVAPNPDGSPVVASVTWRAMRGASPFVTAVVKNQVAT